MMPVSQGKPCAGNPHARFEEGASAPETPRRNALLHKGICTAKKTTCRYVLKRMARFLNRKSQRYYRLKFADTYYGEMTHYGLYRLAWADVRRAR